MPRYDRSDRTPKSKTRRSMLRRRGELRGRGYDTGRYYWGYAHGINGPSRVLTPYERNSK